MNGSLFSYVKDVMPSRNMTETTDATIDFFLIGINGLDEASDYIETLLIEADNRLQFILHIQIRIS